MKAWRKAAKFHNQEAGLKHQGRKNKDMWTFPKMPSDLVIKLMSMAGMIVLGSATDEMINDGAVV